MEYYQFPSCGCNFEIIGPPPLKRSDRPALKLDFDAIPLNCIATWNLISRGNTKGVFQLESHLGKQWSKKLKPEHLEHLAALGALLRPGCLKAIDEKYEMSMTEIYCKRKNQEMETEYHPALKAILQATYGVLTYQEQAMKIAVALAGFNLQEADVLRKAIGKKKPEEMAKVKKWFLEKSAELKLVTPEEAAEIFGWIEKSQRYSFNKSHALSYGVVGYHCAYVKAHFPLEFYCAWLHYAKDKQDPQEEIRELINDARLASIEVYPPNICDLETNFNTDGEIINFGLADIKGVGPSQVKTIQKVLNGVDIRSLSWYEFLTRYGDQLSKSVMQPLILVGALRHMNEPRIKMLKEYETLRELTDKECAWIKERAGNWDNLVSALEAVNKPKKEGGGVANKKRIEVVASLTEMLRHPITPLEDSINDIAANEETYLGIAITCSRVDGKPGERWNTTCKDCVDGKISNNMILKVQVDEAKEISIKKSKKEENIGKKMAFLRVSDGTCALDNVVCYTEGWEEWKHLLTPGRMIEIQVEKPYKRDGLIVKQVWAI